MDDGEFFDETELRDGELKGDHTEEPVTGVSLLLVGALWALALLLILSGS